MKVKTMVVMTLLGTTLMVLPMAINSRFCLIATKTPYCPYIGPLSTIMMFLGLLTLFAFLTIPLVFTFLGLPGLRSVLKSEGKWTKEAEANIKNSYFMISEFVKK